MVFSREEERANTKTGELFSAIFFTYKKLNFSIYFDGNGNATKLYIKGSLHYYFNGGKHNSNDFTFADFLGVISDLIEKFGINPDDCKLRSLEYGINIIPLAYRTHLILQNTFYHQRKKFNQPIDKPYKQAGNPKQNDFIIKIYDKAFQFPQYVSNELLRFEVKYCRMRELRKIGIDYLSDLLLRENHVKLYKLLHQRFLEILFYDYTISKKKLSAVKQKKCVNYANINYWENMLMSIKEGGLNTKNFDYHKKGLKSITSQYSENIHKQLAEVIENKMFKLLNLSVFKWFSCPKTYPKYTPVSEEKCTPNTHLYIGGIRPINYALFIENLKQEKVKICLVTGLDISMQDEGQVLSTIGLKYYEKYEPKIFQKLENIFLTGMDNKFERTIYAKLSKQIRNRFYNNRAKYNANQTVLFEQGFDF